MENIAIRTRSLSTKLPGQAHSATFYDASHARLDKISYNEGKKRTVKREGSHMTHPTIYYYIAAAFFIIFFTLMAESAYRATRNDN